ncbi:MAG: hypothetical protein A2157_08795 [Deltaproteobacteria bacterium RBG_16_47_11]|nr:MAG: hypothetical protein A2157_08795 [Deltaproteobacteria bacterium RBG_16_47_11]
MASLALGMKKAMLLKFAVIKEMMQKGTERTFRRRVERYPRRPCAFLDFHQAVPFDYHLID